MNQDKSSQFCQENTLDIANTFSKSLRDDSIQGNHQMVNPEIGLIMFFAAENGETLSSQQKQDLEMTVAQLVSSLLQNSGLK